MFTILIPSNNEPKLTEMVKATEAEFPSAQIIVCNDRYGKGKGWAIRQALSEASGEIICFIDGDLDIHPRMIHRLIPFLDDYDIVIGKKIVRKNFFRKWLTRLTRIYITLFFGLNYDTQTGIKLFKRYALLPWSTDSYIFDMEILYNARQKGLQVIEVPVEITDYGSGSKPMRFINIFRCFRESLKLLCKIKKG